MDYNPPGSSVHGILQARILEWVAISFSNAWKWKVKVKSLSRVRLFATPWTVAYQAPRPWDFPGKSTGVCCPCLLLTFQFSSVAQSCPTLCDPMNCSTPGLPVHYQLPEFTETHVHWVSDAIQSSQPLSSPSPPAPNPSQHQSLFQWVNSSHEVYWSFSFSIIPSKEIPGLISFRMDWLDLLASKGLSRVFSNATVQKHRFLGTQLSSQSNSHIHTWPLEKP